MIPNFACALGNLVHCDGLRSPGTVGQISDFAQSIVIVDQAS